MWSFDPDCQPLPYGKIKWDQPIDRLQVFVLIGQNPTANIAISEHKATDYNTTPFDYFKRPKNPHRESLNALIAIFKG